MKGAVRAALTLSALLVSVLAEPGLYVHRFSQANTGNRENSIVSIGKPLASVDSRFLSVALDTSEVKWKFKGLDFRSKTLQNLAAGLAPTNMRLGGTQADFLKFDPDGDDEWIPCPQNEVWEERYQHPLRDPQNVTLTGSLWSSLTNFTQLVGWDVMFDFNVFLWSKDGSWDPSNAAGLLNYSTTKQIPIPAFQLGNEPDLFHHYNISIPGDQMAKNYMILKDLINHYGLYHSSQVIGPDVTSVGRNPPARAYLADFLKAGASKAISGIGLHQYYLNGRTATLDDFLNPAVLDKMKTVLNNAIIINQAYPPLINILMTETSSCYGGGAEGLSDKYVAGFLWLDKLGVCAQYGVKAVFRQSFYGGNYALLSPDCRPNPDYFLSVLYKRLVVGNVFNISVEPQSSDLRVYANCANNDFYKYPKGSVVVFYLNLRASNISLTLDKYQSEQLDLFQLTPGDSDGLKSQFVKLNGDKLEMAGSDLPSMLPVKHQGPVILPAQTFGFIVVPAAQEPLCM